MIDYYFLNNFKLSNIVDNNIVTTAPIKLSHRQLISILKYIKKIIICDIQAAQNTELAVIFFIKNATRNIPKIVPQKIDPIMLTN